MNKNSKTLNFLRKNAMYFIMAFCIIAIGLSITLVLLKGNKTEISEEPKQAVVDEIIDDTPTKPVETIVDDKPTEKPVVITEKVYTMPVISSSSISEYSTALVFNTAMKRYSAHMAIDFFAEEGTPVYAVSDGVVESVETTLIYGTTVVIDHGNGIKSIYNSLLDGDKVVVGQKVTSKDIIGEVSVSNRQEAHEGAHLHFSMTENGETVDPAKFISFLAK